MSSLLYLNKILFILKISVLYLVLFLSIILYISEGVVGDIKNEYLFLSSKVSWILVLIVGLILNVDKLFPTLLNISLHLFTIEKLESLFLYT